MSVFQPYKECKAHALYRTTCLRDILERIFQQNRSQLMKTAGQGISYTLCHWRIQ